MYEWLIDYRKLEEEIMYLEFNLDRSERELRRWSGGDLNQGILHEKSNSSGLEETIANIRYELAHKMNDVFDLEVLINTFEGLEYKILYKKNVEGKTLEVIANELNYSTNYIKMKHANIMRMMRYANKVSSK